MKYKSTLFVLALLMIAFFVNAYGAVQKNNEAQLSYHSDNTVAGNIKLASNKLGVSKKELISSFLASSVAGSYQKNSSHQDYLPIISDMGETGSKFFSQSSLAITYPWLEPLLYPAEAPKALSIFKWNKPIKVSTRFPNNLEPYTQNYKEKISIFGENGGRNPFEYVDILSELENSGVSSEKDIEVLKESVSRFVNAEKLVSQELNKTISKIKPIIDLEYVGINDSDLEAVNLVVVLMGDKAHWKYNKNTSSSRSSYIDEKFRYKFFNHIDQYLYTAVNFTSGYDNQVEGFFVPDADGSIQFSVCYIWYGHSTEKISLATRECLLRSLGFPNSVITDQPSVISLWNEESDRKSKTELYSLLNSPQGLLNYDEMLLRLLYSSDLAPGQSYINFLQHFYKGD